MLKIKTSCGSCSLCELIRLPYAEQLRLKHDEFRSILNGVNAPILPFLPSPKKSRFRNKLILPLQRRKGRLCMGFYKPGTHEIMEFRDCHIQDGRLAQAALAVKGVLEKFPLDIYDEKKHSGLLRHLFLRSSSATGRIQAAFIASGRPCPEINKIAHQLKSEFRRKGLHASGLLWNVNEKRTNVILGDREYIVFGKPKLEEKILGLDFEVSLSAFLQTNPGMAERMYKKVQEFLDLQADHCGLDLYCGIGSMTLPLAKMAKRVTGIDSAESSIRDARHNARLNGIKNAEFLCLDLDREAPPATKKIDFVVADPPRQGLSGLVMKFLNSRKVKKIVYVSCNPASLRRDLMLLQEGGYAIKAIQPVDMFPHTKHIESVALLEYPG
ncbi:MAG: 23S rRNA (uracil(1939)-C(5))-methyltransferase RlmD [Nitrospinae bacterium]|nr:23S rRNA (uracil(1939)-C(5))-methyltransferase RlmD [Nitrospinota bacterium]